jgi:hypothetical protein
LTTAFVGNLYPAPRFGLVAAVEEPEEPGAFAVGLGTVGVAMLMTSFGLHLFFNFVLKPEFD